MNMTVTPFKLLAGLLLLVSTSIVSAANDFTALRIPRTASPPLIDGAVSDAEWAGAARMTPFCIVGKESVANDDLMIKAAYDDENLYFAFRVTIDFDPEIAPMAHDSGTIFSVDALEFLLLPDKEIRQFVMERGGGTYDARSRGYQKMPAGEWNPKWRAACRIIPKAFFATNIWEGEIAIPWAALDIAAPARLGELACQVARHGGNTLISAELPDRVSSWAPVGDVWALMATDRYGKLIMGGELPVMTDCRYIDFSSGEVAVEGTVSDPAAEVGVVLRAWDSANFEKRFLLAESKVTGGGFDIRRTVEIDVPKNGMMYWILNDRHGKLAGTKAQTRLTPPWSVEVAQLRSQDKLVLIQNDLSRIAVSNGSKVEITITGADGVVVGRKTVALPPKPKFFEAEISTAGLADGAEAMMTAAVIGGNGRTLYTCRETFTKIPAPEWLNGNPGAVTAPPIGWEPIKVTADADGITTAVRSHAYRFSHGIFPEEIVLNHRPITTEAVSFDVVTSAGKCVFTSDKAPQIASQDERGVTLDWEGSSGTMRLKAKVRIEFDGLAWYDVTLDPGGKPIELRELSLRMALDPAGLRYMRGKHRGSYYALIGNAKTERELPRPAMPFVMEVSGNGWCYGDAFCSVYWLGDEKSGFYFILPSLENTNMRDRFSEVIDEKGRFEVKFNLVNQPMEISRPLDYRFGLMLTPTRQPGKLEPLRRVVAGWTLPEAYNPDFTRSTAVPDRTFNNSMGHRFLRPKEPMVLDYGYLTTAFLPCWTLKHCMIGAPEPPQEEIDLIDGHVKGIRDSLGSNPILWYDSLFSMYHLPRAKPFVYEWERYPRERINVEMHGTAMCPTDAWADYYLYGAANRLKQGITGFYQDMSSLEMCSNRFHGCGWRDSDGNIHGVIPFLECREMFLRYQNLVKSNDPNGLLLLHGNTVSPLCTWFDVVIFGEEWTTTSDYRTLTPELFQLSNMGTGQLGPVVSFFAGLLYSQYPTARESSVTQTEVFGLSLIHNEYPYNGNAIGLPGLQMLWRATEAFGTDSPDSEWIPYWRNPVSDYPGGVAVSSYRKPDGRELLVIFNPAYEEAEYDLGRWTQVRNAMDGNREVKAERFRIEPRGFRLYQVK